MAKWPHHNQDAAPTTPLTGCSLPANTARGSPASPRRPRCEGGPLARRSGQRAVIKAGTAAIGGLAPPRRKKRVCYSKRLQAAPANFRALRPNLIQSRCHSQTQTE
ncbi:hypothetical protein SKAU_G00269300 [Synaphobranchus kaupii]|uniref:Uncharacterized protein n=1 Tax=Synaphobranchus kaupii TaxID=118154 RepID=A0A9Q1F092_SYNKA|nr:hypothetical protein SKAU_G00269300 [Synaphobranchus kaupii]